jgi:hypothetical protein
MQDDQRHGRIFGLLFILTFVTSILAYILFQDILDDPAAYIAEDGKDNVMYLAVLLEFFLIVANVGTAVVLYPIAKRQNQALAIGFVAARIIESVFIAAGTIFILGVVSLRQDSPDAADLAVSLAALKDWTFLFGPGFTVPLGNGLILGYLMYRSGLRPAAHGLARDDRRAAPLHLEHRRSLRVVGDRQHDPWPLRDPGVHLGGVPRHLLRHLGVQEGLSDPSPNLAR